MDAPFRTLLYKMCSNTDWGLSGTIAPGLRHSPSKHGVELHDIGNHHEDDSAFPRALAREGDISMSTISLYPEMQLQTASQDSQSAIASVACGCQSGLDQLLCSPSDGTLEDSGELENVNPDFYVLANPADTLSMVRMPAMTFYTEHVDQPGLVELKLCEANILKLQHQLQEKVQLPGTAPEAAPSPVPPEETSLRYIQTYFATCQIIYPIVRKEAFDQAWARYGNSTVTSDISWNLLLNSILALGAFTEESGSKNATYQKAKAEGTRYFQNAFHFQGRLFQSQPTLMAVQAYMILGMFAQMIAAPGLISVFCGLAVQTAHSLNMHKRSKVGSGMDSPDQHDRSRTYWILYCWDKYLNLLHGRNSYIVDAHITCPFPPEDENESPSFDEGGMQQLRSLARLSTVYSAIFDRLYTTSALDSPTEELWTTRDELCQSLDLWREEVPKAYQIDQVRFRTTALPGNVKPVRALVLRIFFQFAHYSIHRRFSTSLPGRSVAEEYTSKSAESELACVGASRELILLLDRVELGIDVPNWFLICHLLTAMMPLLHYIIAHPAKETVKDDIALLHVAAGIFGRLGYHTSGELNLDTVAELPQLTARFVEKRRLLSGPRAQGHEDWQYPIFLPGLQTRSSFVQIDTDMSNFVTAFSPADFPSWLNAVDLGLPN